MLTAQSLGRAVVCALVAVATFGAGNAAAQVDYEIMAALQFNFSNPGARSLALAGALTGAGDDATGAWTNPGGLTNISRAEIGFEFRRFDFSTLFVNQGRFDGQLTNIGVDTLPPPILAGESNDKTNALSFVSAVIPRSRWAFAFYRTELANFETAIRTEGVFFDQNNAPQRLLPVDAALDIKIANYGGSFAVRASDQFSLGVGLSIYDFSLESIGLRYRALGTNNINLAVQPGFFFGPPLRTAANVDSTELITGDDTAFGVNVGVSINPSDKVRFGASYRQGPKFDISYERIEDTVEGGESTFQVPDVYAFGALIKPNASLNLAFDYRFVRYSQLTQNMTVVISSACCTTDDYVIDDANEIRLAGEYLFTNVPFGVLAVRGGAWFDPDHRIRFEGDPANKADTILFPPGEDEWHITGGGGIVFPKVQIDLGYDYSERVKTFSVSAIYRF